MLYSEENEQPYWVAYLLTDDKVPAQPNALTITGRILLFRLDPIPSRITVDLAMIAGIWHQLPK